MRKIITVLITALLAFSLAFTACRTEDKFTITFNGNGGTPASRTVRITEGGMVTPLNNFTRTGFTLSGWNTRADGSGAPFTAATAVTADITVYAQWVKDTDPPDGEWIIYTDDDWYPAINQINEADPGTPGRPKRYNLTIESGYTILVVGAAFTPAHIEVTLDGGGTLKLDGSGSLLRIGANQSVILDGAALEGQGISFNNTASLVHIDGGSFTMKNGSVSGNKYLDGSGGGVLVDSGGRFTMNGGAITNNEVHRTGATSTYGGGVGVLNGSFQMTGGAISNNNNNESGSGVGVGENGNFIMDGGAISGNTTSRGVYIYLGIFTMNGGVIGVDPVTGAGAPNSGGGVSVAGTFNMYGGAISGNNTYSGGGVSVSPQFTFNMYGGTISNNTATQNGGGVYIGLSIGVTGAFNKTGGVIAGNIATDLGNEAYWVKSGASYYRDDPLPDDASGDISAGPDVTDLTNWTQVP